MDLSVVIVNYNVRHFLEQCLKSVRKASENVSCEVFVVDNNSADGSCSMVSTSFPGAILIRNRINAGFSAACNQAIKLSTGEFILLLNPDTVVEEDTFVKCVKFMKDHPDAGALGVKMINGKGKLLPESKRAFPTPANAFYKISGLSGLFPRSGFLNRYYLGHLDSSETTQVDVLSGAFMFLRRKAIDKTGMLDETFFMYGEDIDLSYRLIKAGFRNYYYPLVKIIHYKGESTRKGEMNHIIHFYRAMLIFIRKHSNGREYRHFSIFIQSAIYLLGAVAVFKNIISRFILPLVDAVVIVAVFAMAIPLWGRFRFGEGYAYPAIFGQIVIPLYAIINMLTVFLSGGYNIPSRPAKVIKGLLIGSALVFVIYALLPAEYRFSRAIIFIGSLSVILIIPLLRILLSVAGVRSIRNPFAGTGKTAIVSDEEGYLRISKLISTSRKKQYIAGRVGIRPDDLGKDVLGSIGQLKEIITINNITEIIFSTRELSASQIIESMQLVSEYNIEVRISPRGENLLIGSSSVSPGNYSEAV